MAGRTTSRKQQKAKKDRSKRERKEKKDQREQTKRNNLRKKADRWLKSVLEHKNNTQAYMNNRYKLLEDEKKATQMLKYFLKLKFFRNERPGDPLRALTFNIKQKNHKN